MRIEGDEVILYRKRVAIQLGSYLGRACADRERTRKYDTDYQLKMLDGALSLLGVEEETAKEILTGVEDPTDENLFKAYQAVVREFGPVDFGFMRIAEQRGVDLGLDFSFLERMEGTDHEN